MVNPLIFREYDIRGIADTELTDDVAMLIGKAFGSHIQQAAGKEVVVGHDNRVSSYRIRSALIEGLLSTGCDVLDVGEVPTPVLYYSIWKYQRAGGVMVTGSHNPPEFNGFKIARGLETIYGPEIQHLREIIETGDFMTGRGRLSEADPVPDYLAYVEERIRPQRRLRVVLDSGNGTTGPVAMRLLKDLGCDVIGLYVEPDGRFPHHIPDPVVPRYMADLMDTVRREKADVGIGLDGDGDRIGAVDERGEIVWGDRLLILFARDLLTRHPGAKVIFDVKSSQAVVEDVQRHGGVPIMWKVGHSLIKHKMREEDALLAAEMSGHTYFRENYLGYDDAIFAAGKLVELLSKHDRPFSALLADIPQYVSSPEIRIDCPDEVKFAVVARARDYFRARYPVIDIDGVRVILDAGWALLRASNTEPRLVLRFEAKTEAEMERIRNMMMDKVREFMAAAGAS